MKQKRLALGHARQLLRVTVRCPHGISVDFEYCVPTRGQENERRAALARTIRNHRHTWRRIEQGQSIFGRCRCCMQANTAQAA
ncbi:MULTISPECIES: hypothetical protein [unclassified Paludibacterium]|uniref:hypothetical protein n=1 Tax=unclassified Paludibacterium TaxID=2618429 RepID=UPI001C059914|nr:hypothetical protein [Paludibacterium sp. B53371]BEV71584.1 hypothetical protein THUN1379_10660 [Paludibacterium sp. THUN1379]